MTIATHDHRTNWTLKNIQQRIAEQERFPSPANNAEIDRLYQDLWAIKGYTVRGQPRTFSEAYDRAFRSYLRFTDTDTALKGAELKDLQANIDAAGGFLASPSYLAELIMAQREASAVISLVRFLPIFEGGLDAPSQESQLNQAQWVTELSAGATDTSAPFGQRNFRPSPLAASIKVSKKLIRASPLGERFVTEALAEALAVPLEAALISGDGFNKPLGVLNTPSLPTLTTAGAGALTKDDVKKWLWGLKGRYVPGATIVCHTDFMAQASQLDDGSLYVRKGEIAGFPVAVSDRFPTAGQALTSLTSGTFLACVGDWRQGYWAVPSLDFSVQVLVELYAATNQNAYLARQEVDGMVVIPNAFRALKVQ